MKKVFKKFMTNKKGFGMNEVLSIAAALIIAAFIVIPQLSNFADKLMDDMDNWWKDEVASQIFKDSVDVSGN